MAGFWRLFLALVSSGILAFWPSCVTLKEVRTSRRGLAAGKNKSGLLARVTDRSPSAVVVVLLFLFPPCHLEVWIYVG